MRAFFKLAPVYNHIVCNSVMLHRPQYSYAVFITCHTALSAINRAISHPNSISSVLKLQNTTIHVYVANIM